MEIAPGVHQVRMLGADAFLIAEERLTLIDAGMVGSALMLQRYLRRIGRRIDELERIICTHGHPDHIGGVSELVRNRPDVSVLIHPD
ncbi:MAG: MBL fold metallo-hydrolase, partial [Candidatus Limnocylindria bacterium]